MRFFTAGESHGPCLTAIIEGLPAGLKIDLEYVNQDLARRQQGYGRGGRMKIERDTAEVLSGIRFGETLGSPVTLAIKNKDWENWGTKMAAFGEPAGEKVLEARPGHADLTGTLKYQRNDIRDILERASARETAARVAVGAVAKQLLEKIGIQIVSHVTAIGGVAINEVIDYRTIQEKKNNSDLSCINPEVEVKMKEAIQQAKQQGDTLGGIFEVAALHVFPGLGSHVQWDRRLDTRLAALMMSIPAIKGVEFGAGFAYATLPGSQAHDEIFYDKQRGYYRRTNRAGGIEGGMSNGETVIARAVMKPIPTLMKPLASVDIVSKQPVKASTERSDVCAVTAAAVVGEAMMAIGLTQILLEQFSRDSIVDLTDAVQQYRRRIAAK
ncbi:Chorismate synthase [Propionispora sp. 2/2-37]|uniref:chorismate synthase n=1 Tax=Propionispora sp. 2/2-37 TaxID=1677858 RepID=UPI0006BB8757|nr:chorismate synthase [Propionispora sp. 2/2-37]CUH94095.1 Chorismate synthase [Propionispora sp. 2/2-37]